MEPFKKCIVLLCMVGSFSSCLLVVDKKDKNQEAKTADSSLADTAYDPAVLSQIDSFHKVKVVNPDTASHELFTIDTKNVGPNEVVTYAETLIGTPYKYASAEPIAGLDCSGFITYVFNHFNIQVPRSSIDFTNVGKSISVANAKRGDLILFTGTDSTEQFAGHMGIVVSKDKDIINFIHSSSGKANGVTITPLDDYYKGRYIKTIRIFKQNEG